MANRVVVAMSGGVDSSVAAALLVAEGYEVIGVTLNVWPRLTPSEQLTRDDACCSLSAAEDARRVADRLGVPHYVLNFRDIFAAKVIDDFVAEYRRGRTPNPCLRCNEHIKFDALLRRALALGADYVATGHYAIVEHAGPGGRHLLRRGVDANKDQSYALYVLKQEQLARTILPLGRLHKSETRRIAAELGLPVANKPESQEICFVPDNDYGAFLAGYTGLRPEPGAIVDRRGNVLGQHRGIVYYTIGQRRGLALAAGKPLYVVAIDARRNEVVVGEESELYVDELLADEANLIAAPALAGPTRATARVRYRGVEAEAEVTQPTADRLQVRFLRPQRTVAPGQAVVLYQGDLVLGGGTILSAEERGATAEEAGRRSGCALQE